MHNLAGFGQYAYAAVAVAAQPFSRRNIEPDRCFCAGQSTRRRLVSCVLINDSVSIPAYPMLVILLRALVDHSPPWPVPVLICEGTSPGSFACPAFWLGLDCQDRQGLDAERLGCALGGAGDEPVLPVLTPVGQPGGSAAFRPGGVIQLARAAVCRASLTACCGLPSQGRP